MTPEQRASVLAVIAELLDRSDVTVHYQRGIRRTDQPGDTWETYETSGELRITIAAPTTDPTARNVPLDDDAFAPPPEVKLLMKLDQGRKSDESD